MEPLIGPEQPGEVAAGEQQPLRKLTEAEQKQRDAIVEQFKRPQVIAEQQHRERLARAKLERVMSEAGQEDGKGGAAMGTVEQFPARDPYGLADAQEDLAA